VALHLRTGTGLRSTIVLLFSVLLIFGLVGAAGAKPVPKVDVCHSASGTFHMINISGNALAAHLAHGDHLGTARDCGTNVTKVSAKVAAGASTSTYSGGVLSVAFTVYKTAGVYSGTGSYYYTKDGRTYSIAVAHACINKTAKTVTVWGPGTSNQSPVTGFGMLSLKDYGTSSMGTRTVFGSSLASLPTTQQCSASPLFPATGTGFLTFW
jgi:hypothetical protein